MLGLRSIQRGYTIAGKTMARVVYVRTCGAVGSLRFFVADRSSFYAAAPIQSIDKHGRKK